MLRLFKKKDPKARLVEALGEAELPSFPGAVMKTLQLLRDPASTSNDIGRSVENNPGLAVKVLSIVNSAAFALRRRVDSVGQAVTLLGRSRVESVVVARAVRDQLPSCSVAGFEPQRFWASAARRAAVSRQLAKRLHPQTESESFIAGLLQDMAVPLLAAARPNQYGPILDRWHRDPDCQLSELERGELGWDHAEIGAAMAASWDLPEHLVSAVGGHHASAVDGDEAAPTAVSLVGLLRESDVEPDVEPLVEACRAIGMQPDLAVRCVEDGLEAAAEIAGLMQ